MIKEEIEQKIDSTGTEKQQNEKLLRLETGYSQHASRSAHSHVPGDTLTPENKRAESIFRFYHKT
jgi:hypothetical protein